MLGFTRLSYAQNPAVKKRVFEFGVTNWLGKFMAGRNWAASTIPLPLCCIILYWMSADPYMPLYRVHESQHCVQDGANLFFLASWVKYGWEMLKNYPLALWLKRKISFTEGGYVDYHLNRFEVEAYRVEFEARDNGLPDWAKVSIS